MSVPDDFALTLRANNGSVPPRYQRSLSLTLDADGRGGMRSRRGYDGDGITETTIKLAQDDLDRLYDDLCTLGLFTLAWAEARRKHIGGSLEHIEATAAGVDVKVPSTVPSEQEEARWAIVQRVLEAAGADLP